MFGFNSLGQYPFSAIKNILGVYYSAIQNESQILLDSSNTKTDFVSSINEIQSVADIEDTTAYFISSINEPQTILDTESVVASFIGSVNESQKLLDTESVVASFIGSVNETQKITDIETLQLAPSGYGFGINVNSDAILNFDNNLTCDLITEQNTLSYHYGNSVTLLDCSSGMYCYQTIIKNYSSNRNISLNAFISGAELRARVIFNPVTKQFLSPAYSSTDSIVDYGYMDLNNGFIMIYMIFNHITSNDNLLFRVQLYNANVATYLGNTSSGIYVGGSEIKYSNYPDSYVYNTSGVSARDNESLYINYQLPTNDFTIYFEWTPVCFANTSNGTIFQTNNQALNGSVSLDYTIQNNILNIILSKNTINVDSNYTSSNTVVYTDPVIYTPPIKIDYSTKKICLRFSSNNFGDFSGMDMFINGTKCIGNTDNSACIVDSKFTIGNDYTNANADNGYHKNFQLFNKVLPDAKLIKITSI